MEFIEKLNLLLKKNNMTGADLCKKLNIPNANYTNWKTRLPRADIVQKIANILNTSTDYLLGNDEIKIEETEIISFYRKADDIGKRIIYKTAKNEADRADIESECNEEKPFA